MHYSGTITFRDKISGTFYIGTFSRKVLTNKRTSYLIELNSKHIFSPYKSETLEWKYSTYSCRMITENKYLPRTSSSKNKNEKQTNKPKSKNEWHIAVIFFMEKIINFKSLIKHFLFLKSDAFALMFIVHLK